MEKSSFEEAKKSVEEMVVAEPIKDLSLVTPQATDLTPESLVEQASAAATVTLIQESDEVKTKILKGAEQVVHNKTEEIKNRAEQQAKKALFENNKSACGCFGFEEETTEKWAVNYMKIWNRIFTLLWLIIGSVTFAPVLFIAGKLRAIIKRGWIAVVLALAIYVVILLFPLWVHLISKVRAIV